jgi:hypothetical protein
MTELTAERLERLHGEILERIAGEIEAAAPEFEKRELPYNQSGLTLAQVSRDLLAEVIRLRALITAPDGGRIPAPLLDELQSIAAESGCAHRAAIAVVAETAYAVGSEHADDLREELEQARAVLAAVDEHVALIGAAA